MGRKRNKRRRAARYKRIKVSGESNNPIAPLESEEEARKKFPKKLVEVFVELVKSGWEHKKYEAYVRQAKSFLGREKYEDKIESGKLIVKLSNACSSLTEEYRKAKANKCYVHPNYKGLRYPRSGCSGCLKMYNANQAKKKNSAPTPAARPVKKKKICEEHPKYQGLRTPRTGCEGCWAIYNGKKAIKKTTKKENQA